MSSRGDTPRPDPHALQKPANLSLSPAVRIVSWMGGEHWYIGSAQFLRLEEAIAFCDRKGLLYEIVSDPVHFYRHEGD